MKKKQEQRIDAALNKALAPPRPRPSSALNEILSQYTPPEQLKPTVENPTIVKTSTVEDSSPQLWKTATVEESSRVEKSTIVKGWTRVPNHLLDVILKTLHPTDQIVLLRLARLSYGFKSETCCVGYGSLAKACNISTKQAAISVGRLLAAGRIERLGVEQGGAVKQERGTTYRIVLPEATMEKSSTVENSATVEKSSTNKVNTLKETHNTEDVVRVSSRFALSDCRNYAEHLKASGQGITNPGGYATKIYWSGEADELIEKFLAPAHASVDASQCPDCGGTGFYYPTGMSGGVVKCKHERLSQQ